MSNASLKEQLQAIVSSKIERKDHTPTVTKEKPKMVAKAKSLPPRVNPRGPKQQTPKPKWLEHALFGVELLKAYFPACFLSGSMVKPLKKGIKQDLVKFLSTIDTIVTEDKACMVKSLTYYVNTASYHKSVVEGASRIDLSGNAAGVVTAEEASYSIDRQKAKRHAKLAAPVRVQSKTQEVITE